MKKIIFVCMLCILSTALWAKDTLLVDGKAVDIKKERVIPHGKYTIVVYELEKNDHFSAVTVLRKRNKLVQATATASTNSSVVVVENIQRRPQENIARK